MNDLKSLPRPFGRVREAVRTVASSGQGKFVDFYSFILMVDDAKATESSRHIREGNT